MENLLWNTARYVAIIIKTFLKFVWQVNPIFLIPLNVLLRNLHQLANIAPVKLLATELRATVSIIAVITVLEKALNKG